MASADLKLSHGCENESFKNLPTNSLNNYDSLYGLSGVKEGISHVIDQKMILGLHPRFANALLLSFLIGGKIRLSCARSLIRSPTRREIVQSVCIES